MSCFVKSWDSTAKMDDCIFCGGAVLENQLASSWKREGTWRTVHAACVPQCSRYGDEEVTIGPSGFALHPELKPGMRVTRKTPCWSLWCDEDNVCSYHHWLDDHEPGDAWM